jgi:hypothetical protein
LIGWITILFLQMQHTTCAGWSGERIATALGTAAWAWLTA